MRNRCSSAMTPSVLTPSASRQMMIPAVMTHLRTGIRATAARSVMPLSDVREKSRSLVAIFYPLRHVL